jgi:hypothetical protein
MKYLIHPDVFPGRGAARSGAPQTRSPSHESEVPDQRCTAALRFALHRIRDTTVFR